MNNSDDILNKPYDPYDPKRIDAIAKALKKEDTTYDKARRMEMYKVIGAIIVVGVVIRAPMQCMRNSDLRDVTNKLQAAVEEGDMPKALSLIEDLQWLVSKKEPSEPSDNPLR
jgi:hypothetical protein